MNMQQQNRMKEGSGESSYAQNSVIQTCSIVKAFPIINDALEGLYSSMTPEYVMVAELGCATGPNALKLIPEFVGFTYEKFRAMNKKQVPQIHVFLNDLYFNDYNTLSRSLPTFKMDLEKERLGDIGPLYISMTPGCYQNRVFPDNFLHFVHCANSAHWLTQAPNPPLTKDGKSLTKDCLYMTSTSPPEVLEAYQQQFARDFTSFLESRAQEIVQRGRMVLNIMVSSQTYEPHNMWIVKFLDMTFKEMLLEGWLDEEKASGCLIHFYPPTMEEVQKLVGSEESFLIHKHETFVLDWDMPDERGEMIDVSKRAKFVAETARVAIEYIISSQFGDAFAENFFHRFTDLVRQHLENGVGLKTFHQIISLIKK